MTQPRTIAYDVDTHRVGREAVQALCLGGGPRPSPPSPRIPRIARLLARGWNLHHLIETGVLADQAEAAGVGRVSGAASA
jgi:hypothetical protein